MTLNRWSALLALLGLAISVYLTVVHYAQGQVPLVCASGGVVNCEVVTSSAESGVGPVPVALLGAIWFGMYLGLLLRGTAGPYRLAWAATGLAFVSTSFTPNSSSLARCVCGAPRCISW
jgi:uncharacterized membrane protein